MFVEIYVNSITDKICDSYPLKVMMMMMMMTTMTMTMTMMTIMMIEVEDGFEF